jgi:hypothetical protein
VQVAKDLESINKIYAFLRHKNSAATKHMGDGIIPELCAATHSTPSSETGSDADIVDDSVGDDHGSVDDTGGALDDSDGEASNESGSDDTSDIASGSPEGSDCDSRSVDAGRDKHDSEPDV